MRHGQESSIFLLKRGSETEDASILLTNTIFYGIILLLVLIQRGFMESHFI